MKFTPHQLACFLATADERSFSHAAEKLHVSQPALSRTIKLMEEWLGARLFDRTTRSVSLTPLGKEFLTAAQRIMSEIDLLTGDIKRFADGQKGRVTVAALPSVAASILPEAISNFSKASPDVSILIRDRLSEDVLKAIESGDADFGLTVMVPHYSTLEFEPLVEDELGLVALRDNPLFSRPDLNWKDLEDQKVIAMVSSSSVRRRMDDAMRRAEVKAELMFECSNLGTTARLVATGLGITALPRLTMPLADTSLLRWKLLREPVITRVICIVRRRKESLSPAASNLLDQIRLTAAAAFPTGTYVPS